MQDQKSRFDAEDAIQVDAVLRGLCSTFRVPHSGKLGQGGWMSRTWKQSLISVPGIGASLLPKLACPFCWPAYAGLFGYSGLSGDCCWSAGVPGESSARLRAFRTWSVWRRRSLGRQVLVGVKSHDVRVSGGAGAGFGVECMASSSSSAGLLCGKLN